MIDFLFLDSLLLQNPFLFFVQRCVNPEVDLILHKAFDLFPSICFLHQRKFVWRNNDKDIPKL